MSFSCAVPSTPRRASAIPVLDSPSSREWQPLISLDSPEPPRSLSVERVEKHEDWTNRFSEQTWSRWIDIFGETDKVQETLQEPFSLQDSPQHLKSALQSQVFAWPLKQETIVAADGPPAFNSAAWKMEKVHLKGVSRLTKIFAPTVKLWKGSLPSTRLKALQSHTKRRHGLVNGERQQALFLCSWWRQRS